MTTSLPASVRPSVGRDELRVASVPSSHVYVRHLAPEAGSVVHRLADPDPEEPGRSTQERWWPPVMLDPEWIRGADFDVFHLQFGFDVRAPDELEEVVDALRRSDRPLVYTVHDLRNPHHADRALHDRQLDVLVPAAAVVVTLTDGAAGEIRRRWGREAVVVPHPHVVPFDVMARLQSRPRRHAGTFRVGLHLKSLRESMAPLRILPALLTAVRSIPGGVLQVNGHRDVLDEGGARYDAELASYVRREAAAGDMEVQVHDFMSDQQLWHYLASLDVSVLPYRFGTHSGWSEACRDLGTTVVAPSCGYIREQGPVVVYEHDEDRYEPDTLVAAVHTARDRPQLGRHDVSARRAQRAHVARMHEQLYRAVV